MGCLLLLVLVSLAVSTQGQTGADEHDHDDHSHITFEVGSILTPPFLEADGDTYKGFIKDLLEKLKEHLKFNYNIHMVGDGKYGAYDTDRNQWSGLIGELKYGQANMAAAALTVTDKRKEVVHFTEPFMTFGIVILVKKDSGINSIDDLLASSTVKPGTIMGGSTEDFLKDATDPKIAQLWAKIRSDGDASVDSGTEGAERVRRGDYAFIMEGPAAEYLSHQEPCDLQEIVLVADHGAYSLAFSDDHKEHVPHFNEALDHLKDDISHLHHQYFHGACDSDDHGHHEGDEHDHDEDHAEEMQDPKSNSPAAIAVASSILITLAAYVCLL